MQRKREQAPKWVKAKFGRDTVRLLNVSQVKGKSQRWPELVMMEVPGSAKKRVSRSGQVLCQFLNKQKVFSKPARKVVRSVTVPSQHTTWLALIAHARTSMLIVVWIPIS